MYFAVEIMDVMWYSYVTPIVDADVAVSVFPSTPSGCVGECGPRAPHIGVARMNTFIRAWRLFMHGVLVFHVCVRSKLEDWVGRLDQGITCFPLCLTLVGSLGCGWLVGCIFVGVDVIALFWCVACPAVVLRAKPIGFCSWLPWICPSLVLWVGWASIVVSGV